MDEKLSENRESNLMLPSPVHNQPINSDSQTKITENNENL